LIWGAVIWYVSGDNAVLLAYAGRDIQLTTALLQSAGNTTLQDKTSTDSSASSISIGTRLASNQKVEIGVGNVQTNANNILGEQNFTNPKLSVRGVGGAVTGEVFTEAATKVVGTKAVENITFTYFKNDPVPVVTGGNPGVISLTEFWKVLTTSNSAHSCYGTGAAGCSQVEILAPKAPEGAEQSNSNLIRYVGGIPYDASGKPLIPTN